jgi:hypothetical protein
VFGLKITDIITKQDLGEPYDRLSDFLELEEIVRIEQSYNGQQIKFNRNSDNLVSEYPELVSAVGKEKALKVINTLGNMRVYFPTLKKSASDKIKKLIVAEFNGYNYRQLSRKYGYTERYIRQILSGRPKKKPVLETQLSLDDIAETG